MTTPQMMNATLVAFEELKKPNPHVDHDFLTSLYETLGSLEVELDEDPLLHGPRRLRSLIATARNYLTECERMYLRVAKHLHVLKSNHRRAKAAFEIKINHLLASDPDVRSQRNLDTQRAMATDRYLGEYVQVQQYEQAVEEVSLAEQVVKTKKSDLRDVQRRLNQQMRLCLEEISSMGARWSKLPPGKKPPTLGRAPARLDPVDELLLDMEDAPAVVARPSDNEQGETPFTASEGNDEEEVNDFLADLAAKPQRSDKIEEINIDKVLSDF